MKTLTIPQKQIKVIGDYDVVVCGGGTAGVFAAISAADEGCSVCLIEQFGSLGGTPTNGVTTPHMGTHIKEEPLCSYIAPEVFKKLLEINGVDERTGRKFDPMALRVVLEGLCSERKIKIMLHTFVCDVIKEKNEITGVVVASKSGVEAVTGRIFIDCTGDGDVSVLAGANYTKGNPETGKNQPVSLRYIVGGVDVKAFCSFIDEEIARTGVASAASYNLEAETFYASITASGTFTMSDVFRQAINNGDLVEEDAIYWQMFDIPGRKDAIAFNNPEFFDYVDATNTDHLTFTQIEGKKAIYRQLKFYKKYMKGFENAYIAEIATMVGIRESRNITADYVLSGEELLSKAKFDDAISQSNYPVDIHGRVLDFGKRIVTNPDGKPYYEIPYRSLLVKGIDNLMVAGRCLGADFLAESAIRIQITMRSTGEAAGLGAAMAVKAKQPMRSIDGIKVRAAMIKKGAHFLEK